MATVRGPRIVNNGLVLCVNAADRKSYRGSGATWFDLSGNNLNATITNSPTFSTDTGGKFNIPVWNSNQYFNFPVSSLLNFQSSNFTICCWIKPGQYFVTSGGQYILWDLENSYTLYYPGNANSPIFTLRFGTYTAGAWTYTVSTDYRSYVNVWHLLTCVRNGSSCQIYANTTNIVQTAGTHSNPASQATYGLYFATNRVQGFSTVCDGDYSAFMAYNRALSVAEITQNFNAQRGRFGI